MIKRERETSSGPEAILLRTESTRSQTTTTDTVSMIRCSDNPGIRPDRKASTALRVDLKHVARSYRLWPPRTHLYQLMTAKQHIWHEIPLRSPWSSVCNRFLCTRRVRAPTSPGFARRSFLSELPCFSLWRPRVLNEAMSIKAEQDLANMECMNR